MKRRLLLLASLAGLSRVWGAQTKIAMLQMPGAVGPGLRGIDSSGGERILGLDPSIEITAANIVRVNPASLTPVRPKGLVLPFTASPLRLPDVPTAIALVSCNGLVQSVGATRDFTASGADLTPTAGALPIWQAAGEVTVFYFF